MIYAHISDSRMMSGLPQDFLWSLLQEHPYFWVFLIVFIISLVPILTPPTWMVVSSAYAFNNSLNPLLLALLGATAATAGRLLLLRYSSLGRRKLNRHRKSSLEKLHRFLEKTRYGYFIGTFIFAMTPLPSNMLFISYGLMNARSIGIIAGFWIGRFIVYFVMIHVSDYVFRPLIYILGDNLAAIILTDIIGVIMTIFILIIDWDKVISERKLAIIRPKLGIRGTNTEN